MRIFRLFNKFEPLGEIGINFRALHSVGHLVSWNEFINSFIQQDRVYFWNDELFKSNNYTHNYEVYDLIFVNFHHTSTSSSVEDRFVYLNEFLTSNNTKKIVINCYLAFKDPQEVAIPNYNTIIYKADAFELFSPDHFQDLIKYNKRVLINKCLSIEESIKDFNFSGAIIFHLALSANIWRKLDSKKKFLSFFKSPSIELARQKTNNNKDKDIVITGESIPYIYPFRFNAFDKIKDLNITHGVSFVDTNTFYFKKKQELQSTAVDFNNQPSNSTCTSLIIKAQQLYHEIIDDYYSSLARSKVGIACSSIYGYPLGKYFEMMANGVIVIADSPIDNEDIGLIPGENFIESTPKDIISHTLDIITNHQKYRKIKENALEYVNSVYNARSNSALVLKEMETILNNL